MLKIHPVNAKVYVCFFETIEVKNQPQKSIYRYILQLQQTLQNFKSMNFFICSQSEKNRFFVISVFVLKYNDVQIVRLYSYSILFVTAGGRGGSFSKGK